MTIEITSRIHIKSGDILLQIKDGIEDAAEKAFTKISSRFQDIIVINLIAGSSGWKPLINGHAWKWINSPRGYAQLGFSDAAQPLVLLGILKQSFRSKAFIKRKSIKVVSANTIPTKFGIEFDLFDVQEIKKKTIHPAAGTGKLKKDTSWFEWVYAGNPKSIPATFIRVGPRKGIRSSAIAGSMAGFMKKGGSWDVPPKFRIDLDLLVERNQEKITSFMEQILSDYLKVEFS